MKRERKKGDCLIFLGLLLIAAALLLTVYNLYDEKKAERSVQTVMEQMTLPEEQFIPNYVLNPNMAMPTKEIDGVAYIGVVKIPALDLELPVISQWSYPSLKKAPCRYRGSAYLHNLIICGHNYDSHFGNLKTLHLGDAVNFTDVDGNEFSYRVAELETLERTDIEEMKQGDWDLTLFTCTIGGKTRVTVRCLQVE